MVSASQLWTQYAHPPQPVAMSTLPWWKCESKQMLPLRCFCQSSLSQRRKGASRGTMNFLLKSSVWLGPCIKGHQGACGESILAAWLIQYRWFSCHHCSGTSDAVEVELRLKPKTLDFGLEWISAKISTSKRKLSIQAAWPGSFYTQL